MHMSSQRKATLEIDRMVETKLPPGEVSTEDSRLSNPSVIFEEIARSLKEIFSKAGINLEINASDKKFLYWEMKTIPMEI